MSPLFPPIRENHHFFLDVGHGYQLYVEECGNPDGIPVVFLHGGPGSGCESWHRQFFDPEHYRIVLFDQRGCGRSKPHASLEHNTTWDLVADMEKIREHLGIKQWMVLGGSWGSTLALAYAQTHADRVLHLITRGIFLCREQDINWFYEKSQGASQMFPDYFQDYLAPIPEDEQHELVNAYYKRLTGKNDIARMQAAKAWAGWEGRLANLTSKERIVDFFTDPYTALSVARLEAHYFVNRGWFTENQLVNDAHKLNDIDGVIIHGRYDMICPVQQAYELHQAWSTADLQIIPACGHAASEEPIQYALIRATNQYLKEHL